MKDLELLALMMLAGWLVRWCLLPHGQLPRFRVGYLRLRLLLRLHPGRGHATVFELWLRWGRLAAFRRSGRSRRSVPAWQRMLSADGYSVRLGRAQLGHGLRIPLIGNPRYQNLLNRPACRQGYDGAARRGRVCLVAGRRVFRLAGFPWAHPRRRHGRSAGVVRDRSRAGKG